MASNLKISIDILLNGAEQLRALGKSINDLAKNASGVTPATKKIDGIGEAAIKSIPGISKLITEADKLKSALSGVTAQATAALAAIRALGKEKGGGGRTPSTSPRSPSSPRGGTNPAAEHERADKAALLYARTLARIQQVSGDIPAAIKTLGSALDKATDRKSLSALRVELQKTYLDTNYANSPLIGAIRNINQQTTELAGNAQRVGVQLTAALTLPLLALGAASVKSATDIDKQVNVLKVFTGGAANAERRLAELIATAQKTPGLTTGLAATLDAQLRVAQVLPATIDRILPAIGRLNAISPLGDPSRFAQNLVQIVTQNFEKADLKELIGNSPFAGELIKQIFNVDSPTNADAIRTSAAKLGIKTTDQFFAAFAAAAANNPKLQAVTESIASQFDKLQDRIAVALRPLGLALINAITPAINAIIPVIEKISAAFASIPPSAQLAIIALAGVAAAIGPAIIALAGAAQAVVVFAGAFAALKTALAAGGALAALPALLNPIGLAIAGVVAVLGIAAVAWATYESAADRAAKVTVEGVKAQQGSIASLKELQRQTDALSSSQTSSANKHAQLQAIIARLDPDTQSYIRAIKDEGLQLSEVNRILREQISLKEGGLSKSLADVGDAASDLADKLAKARAQLELTQKESADFAASGGKLSAGDIFVATAGVDQGAEVITKSAKTLGEAINQTTAEIKAGDDALAAFGAQILALNPLIETNRAAFIAQQRALGRTEDQINGAIAAYEGFRAKQAQTAAGSPAAVGAVDAVTSAMNALRDAARQSGEEIVKAFSAFDAPGLQSAVNKKIDSLSVELAKAGGGVKKAAEIFKKAQGELIQLPGQDQFAVGAISLKDANERLKVLKASRDLIEKQFSPAKATGGGSRAVARTTDAPPQNVLNERQQLEEALLKLREAFITRDLELARQTSERQSQVLESEYADKQITLEKYFTRKAALIDADAKRERVAIQNNIIAEADRLTAAETRRQEGVSAANKRESDLLSQAKKAAERQKIALAATLEREKVNLDAKTETANITAKIVGLEGDLQQAEARSTAAVKDNARARVVAIEDVTDAYLKLRGEIRSIDADLDESAGRLIEAATARTQQQFQKLIDAATVEFGENSAEVAAITARVSGIITDAALREFENSRQLIDTQFQNQIDEIQNLVNAGLLGEIAGRDKVLAIERLQREELEKILKLEIETAKARLPEGPNKEKVLADLKAQQSQAKAKGVDPIFADIRKGLEQDLSGAFNDFIANARFNLEGLKNFAGGVIDSFRRAIAKALSDRIDKAIVKPITNAFLDKVLGVKTIDPNKIATDLNTLALDRLTLALSQKSITDQVTGGQEGLFGSDDVGIDAGSDVTGPDSPLTAFFDKIKGAFDKFANGLKGFATNIGSGLKDLFATIFSAISSVIGGLFGGGGGGMSVAPITFAEGGSTGGSNPARVAGVVHEAEFVEPARVVRRFGPALFEAMRTGALTPENFLARASDYISGLANYSVRPRSGAFASGGLAGIAPVADGQANRGGGATNVRLVNVIDPAVMGEFLDSAAGEQVILNRITRSPSKYRAALRV